MTQREKYHGSKTTRELIKYALKQVPSTVHELWTGNWEGTINDPDTDDKPWLISICGDGGGEAVVLCNGFFNSTSLFIDLCTLWFTSLLITGFLGSFSAGGYYLPLPVIKITIDEIFIMLNNFIDHCSENSFDLSFMTPNA